MRLLTYRQTCRILFRTQEIFTRDYTIPCHPHFFQHNCNSAIIMWPQIYHWLKSTFKIGRDKGSLCESPIVQAEPKKALNLIIGKN